MPLLNTKQDDAAKLREFIFKCFVFFWCACLMVQILSIPYKMHLFTSLSNKALLFSWLAFAFYILISQLFHRVSLPFVCLLFILLTSLLSFGVAVVYQSDLLGRFGDVLGFWMLPLMLYCIKSMGITKEIQKVLLICNLFMSAQYIYLYHSPLSRAFEDSYGEKSIDSVTLGYSNPNQAAIFLFVCLVLLFVSFFFFENKLLRVLIFADFLYLAYIVFQTDSRTAFLMLAVFVFLSFFSFKRRLPAFFTDLALLSPVIYMVLALAFIAALQFIQIDGGDIFTGRNLIYIRYFENLTLDKFLFGDYALFRFENLHNGYLSIAATMGVIVLVAYYVFLRKILRDAYRHMQKKQEKAAYCGAVCLVIYTCTEAGFFIGGALYALLFSVVFFMLPGIPEGETVCKSKNEIKEASDR